MSLYSRCLFPHLCHRALRSRPVSRLRQASLAEVEGEVLEIGFGTGLNLPHYPGTVKAVHAVEPSEGMRELAEKLLAERQGDGPAFPLEILPGRAEDLPFDDGRFDAVVSTFTLCSIPEVARALAEVRRVLRPGGSFHFLEHGESPDPGVRRWQGWLNPIQGCLGDGCRLDRRIGELVAASDLQVESCHNSYLRGSPKPMGYLYQGRARKSGTSVKGASSARLSD